MQTQYTSIQHNLSKFYNRWKDYTKNERQGYQTFLTEFFNCFGITFDDPNELPFEKNTGSGFADAFIKDIVIVEMKDKNKYKTKKDLSDQLPQALKYWEAQKKNVPYLVLCNFHIFIIYDTRDSKDYTLKISELENNVESFNFLLKLNPTFIPEQEKVTKKSAQLMGQFYKSLRMRLKDQDEEVNLFVLQCLFCLFSEDIGYLPPQTFTNCVRRIKDGEDNSANVLSTLFKMMDEKDINRKKGRFQNVRYFNGTLFCNKPEIVLNADEEELLWQSCQLDWNNVRPEIFGALFESSQTKKIRHNDGMHFTSEEDIMKVIKPCILDVWNELVNNCKSLADLREVHKKLKSYRVLDPACGSGNFLVVAYRELKVIESKIFMEYKQLSLDTYERVQEILEWFPITNMYGIEINPFSSFLTKVSLWISKKIIRNQFKLTEPDLPLEDLKHIISADALVVQWNDIDVVVGNPPYIGCKMINKARGDKYFEWLGKRFRNHNRMSDYCTYWFEKVIEDVRPGVRVGFVCTKTISQTNSRIASLDKVVNSGGTIFNAISCQKWSGEAKVFVSIVNYINKNKYLGEKILDGKQVKEISTRLKDFSNKIEVQSLPKNKELAFVGPSPNGRGFILNYSEATELIKKNKQNRHVIRSYLTGDDINSRPDQSPSRWIIDFRDWNLSEAQKYPEALKRIRLLVKPLRDKNRREKYRKYWWRFQEEQMSLRSKISKLQRYICVSRVSKYPIFIFINGNEDILPADSTVTICLDDYEHLGVLQSKFHVDWYKYQCSTLACSLRYTNTTVFETFPFPNHIDPRVGQLMEQIDETRKQICRSQKIGLATLYNNMLEGSYDILNKLHKKLDESVADSYSIDKKKIHSQDLIIEFLISLNLELTKNTSRVS